MFGWWRKRRPPPPIPESQWRATLDAYPFLQRASAEDDAHLRLLTARFLQDDRAGALVAVAASTCGQRTDSPSARSAEFQTALVSASCPPLATRQSASRRRSALLASRPTSSPRVARTQATTATRAAT